MSKMQELADNAPNIISDIEREAGVLHQRLQAVKERGAAALSRWNGYVTEQERATAAVENAINKLSNAPPPITDTKTPPPVPGNQSGGKVPPPGVTLNPNFNGR